METITSIEKYEGKSLTDDWGTEAGFIVTTNERRIVLVISDDSSCCESWGYLMSEDDLDKFTGATLTDIRATDVNRSSMKFTGDWKEDDGEKVIHLEDGGVMFIDLITSVGVLQFVAYNQHNGYYGHTARVASLPANGVKIIKEEVL